MKNDTTTTTAPADIARAVEINNRKYCAVGITATIRSGNLATEALEYSLALREIKDSGRYRMRPFASALAGTRNIDHVFDEYTDDTYAREVALVKCEKLAKALDLPVLQDEADALAKWREEQKAKEQSEKKQEPKSEKAEAKKAPVTLQSKIGRAVSSDKKATNDEKMYALVDCMVAYNKAIAEVLKLSLMERDPLAALAKYSEEALKYRAMSEDQKAEQKAKEAEAAEEKRRQALAAAVGFRADSKREMAAEEREAAALAIKNAERLEKEADTMTK